MGGAGTLMRRVGDQVEQLHERVPDSPVQDERVAARLGVALAVAFGTCFLTGIVSHLHQHPVSWLPLGPDPAWAYRLNQGLHVAAGLACVPLLLAKLFSVYRQLFEWPPVRGAVHAVERGSVAVLIGSALFQVSTGVMNVFQWYPWGFGFTRVHWAVAWVAVGSIVLHVAVQLPAIRRGLGRGADADRPDDPDSRSRRGFLVGTGLTVAGITLATVGQTLRPLGPLAVLAPRRPDVGPQGLPVNRTSAQARVRDLALAPDWELEIVGPAGTSRLTRAELGALDQHEAVLPIACVEGWSDSARWGGVRFADLVRMAGGDDGCEVVVTSLEERGAYRTSTMPPAYARHPDTLLALQIDGEDLHLEHGFPARVIAPNRPGVLQTKWVARLEVRRG